MTAQLGHPDLERDARARGRLLEDERDAAPRQRLRRLAVGLQLGRPVQQGGQLLGRKLLSGQEMTSHPGIVRTVTWNLFHGRDHPPGRTLFTWRSRLLRRTERDDTHVQVNRPLRREFVAALDAVDWQVALLQEAPPRWLPALRAGCRSDGALALTSRNSLGWLRGFAADLNPDLIASGEGGSNMILVRSPGAIRATETVELARTPERRTMLLARLRLPTGAPLCVACMHLSVDSTGQGTDEVLVAADRAVAFAGGEPLLFGGDLNLRPSRQPEAFAELERRHGLAPPTGHHAIDHLLARGMAVADTPHALPAGARELPAEAGRVLRLSDHDLVVAGFEMR
jgi:endonuclease/exonuclease/phosphatase family metal-dependent hydrolase